MHKPRGRELANRSQPIYHFIVQYKQEAKIVKSILNLTSNWFMKSFISEKVQVNNIVV